MATASTPKSSSFVLVKSASPFRPTFRRAGLQFERDWRILEVREVADVDKGIIDAAVLARLEAEPMLAVKPATAAEVESYQQDLAARAGRDPASVIDELKAKNADLEARLMKLELAKGAKGDTK